MAGAADDEHGLAFRHFLNAGLELFQRDVESAFHVAVGKFGFRSHVENDEAVILEIGVQFRGLRRGEAAGSGQVCGEAGSDEKREGKKKRCAQVGKFHGFSLKTAGLFL